MRYLHPPEGRRSSACSGPRVDPTDQPSCHRRRRSTSSRRTICSPSSCGRGPDAPRGDLRLATRVIVRLVARVPARRRASRHPVPRSYARTVRRARSQDRAWRGANAAGSRSTPSVRYPHSTTPALSSLSGRFESGAFLNDRDYRPHAHPSGRPGQGHRERTLRGRHHLDRDAPRRIPDRRGPTRPHPPARLDGRAGAARCPRDPHRRRRPRGPIRRLPEGPDALRSGRRTLGGRTDRGGRGRDTGDRCSGGRADRRRTRTPSGRDRPRDRRALGCPARPRRLGDVRGGREPRPRRERRVTLDHRQRRRRCGDGRRGRRGHRSLRRRRFARGPDRAAGDRRRLAGRPPDDLVVDTGPVRGQVRRRRDTRHAVEPGPGHRAPPRRWLRSEM